MPKQIWIVKTLMEQGTSTTPVDPNLIRQAIGNLSREDAIQQLGQEIQKSAAFQQQLAQLQQRLQASEAREKDLLEVLGKWQERGTG